MKYTFTLLVIIFLLPDSATIQAQPLHSTGAYEKSDSKKYEVIGKMGADFLVYEYDSKAGKKSIHVHNRYMETIKEISLGEIPGDAYNLKFIVNDTALTIVYNYINGLDIVCGAAIFDARLKIKNKPVVLDSVAGANATNINILSSQDKSKLLVYKLQYADSSGTVLSTKIYDPALKLQHSTRSPLAINPDEEELSPFVISNDGEVCFIIQSVNNSKKFEILYNSFKTQAYNSFLVNLKSKRLERELNVTVNDANNSVLVSTFYSGEKSNDIEGVFVMNFDNKTHDIKTTFNTLDSNFVNRIKAYDQNFAVLIKDIIPDHTGGFVITAEMASKHTYTRGAGGSFGVGGGSFNSSYTLNPQSAPDAGWVRLPPSQPGQADRLVYNNNLYMLYEREPSSGTVLNGLGRGGYFPAEAAEQNILSLGDILVCTFSGNMKLKNSAIIPKWQSAPLTIGQQLSFLSLEGKKNIDFLFNESIGKNNFISKERLAFSSAVSSKEIIKTGEKSYRLLPMYSKQVADNQAILALEYANKIYFQLYSF